MTIEQILRAEMVEQKIYIEKLEEQLLAYSQKEQFIASALVSAEERAEEIVEESKKVFDLIIGEMLTLYKEFVDDGDYQKANQLKNRIKEILLKTIENEIR